MSIGGLRGALKSAAALAAPPIEEPMAGQTAIEVPAAAVPDHTAGGMLIGYARVSTRHQDPAAQVRQLKAAGCSRVFVDDGLSSTRRDRPEFLRALDLCRPGDTLTVCRLDRLGGDVGHLLELAADLEERGVRLWSLSEGLDSRTPMGRAQFGMFAVLAQLRIELIREAVSDGLARARAEGRTGGRPPVLSPEQLTAARQLIASGQTKSSVARSLGVGRATLYRALS